MSAHHYPDHFYADALNQKPTGAYDATKLREETIAIAVSQDRDNDALPSILAEMRALTARLERYAERKPSAYTEALDTIREATKWAAPSAEGLETRIIKKQPDECPMADESKAAHNVACDKPICTQQEWDEYRLGWALLGVEVSPDVPKHGDYARHGRHPMAAEALRVEDRL